MTYYATHVHCYQCGKRVSGIDPELGLVVRAFVTCPECMSVPVCINCQRPFVAGEVRNLHGGDNQTRQVGPFCDPCDQVLRAALETRRNHRIPRMVPVPPFGKV